MRPTYVFCGFKQSGKSTLTAHLKKHYGYEVLSFAGPLKSMLATLGLTHEHLYGSEKEEPLDILAGQTPRMAMQTLGTEWGRDIMGADIWAVAWRQLVLKSRVNICNDDCRFHNEVARAKDAGAIIIRVTRPGYHPLDKYGKLRRWFYETFPYFDPTHGSELEIGDLKHDHEIINDKDVAHMVNQLNSIRGKHE